MKSANIISTWQSHLPAAATILQLSNRHFKTLIVILILLIAVIAGGVNLKNAYGQSVQAQNRNELFAQVIQPEANYNVIVRENVSDPTRSDVYLQDPITGLETFYMTLLDVYRAHYHNAEFHNDSLYIIHRTGGDTGYQTNPNWMDDLWRYNQQEPGVKLFSARGLDFRVSNDETFIAITTIDDSLSTYNVTFTDRAGTVLNVTAMSQFGENPTVAPVKWGNSSFWLSIGAGPSVGQFIKIDATNFQAIVFDVSMFPVSMGEYDLDSAREIVAFSDYPIFFDTDSVQAFEQSGTAVTLSVYDLNRQTQQPIATSTAKAFNPRWLDENTLEFNDPNGTERITQAIP